MQRLYIHTIFTTNFLTPRVLIYGEDLLILARPTMDLDESVQLDRLRNAVNLPENILHYPELMQNIPYRNRISHEGFTDAISRCNSDTFCIGSL
ncbi:DUF3616 domain-containing protein [Plectonema radiosum NIES-515]|uniref:DUF3616 domain-containing protein n=1 Tax=Plectonema radiosum NIES-515 TaxID=2986073 RepID=A0ABT3AY26_9CYAN|nr:DUF3616 domain-containing protein [Plectonema radiosum]MCV3214023.1 DUF3616 domain-containing protein [Plectonema radiosum NIES-515]